MKKIWILTLLTLLTACAVPPEKLTPAERDAVYKSFQAQQQHLKYWQFQGRFSLRIDNQSQTGNIRWVTSDNRYGVKLSGPMDQGAVYVAYNGQQASMKDNEGNETTAPTPEALLEAFTQYDDIPVSYLRYWLIGMPVPGIYAQTKTDNQGYPQTLIQNDWTVEYQYLRPVGDFYLPRKIVITNPQLMFKLSIYDWEIADHPLL